MVKAKTAIVIVILALLQVSWTTDGQTRFSGIQAVQEGDVRFGAITTDSYRFSGSQRVGGIQAVMTVNGFQKATHGGGAATCDGRFHSANDLIVALSPGWYAGGKRFHRTIRITSVDTGRTVEAQVVDMCVCIYNCKKNIIHSSPAVWKKLGLHTDIGEVRVTWSDA